MLTIEQAHALHHGDVLIQTRDAIGNTIYKRWRVVSKVKRWKRDPERFAVSVKHGLCEYGTLTNDNMQYLEKE